MQLEAGDILTFLWIIVAVMLIIVLYHLLFIVVDMRKISRRVEDITAQVETIILKPISVADQILTWVLEQVEQRKGHRKHVPHKEEE